MKEEKKESPIGVLWGWGKPYHGKFIGSIILAVLGRGLPDGALFLRGAYCHTDAVGRAEFFQLYDGLYRCIVRLFGKGCFRQSFNSHFPHSDLLHAARSAENITAKLARVPMGTILDTPSGQYKTTIVDRVEGMESTFAHLIPEMTANVLVPLVIVVYLFFWTGAWRSCPLLRWWWALLSCPPV